MARRLNPLSKLLMVLFFSIGVARLYGVASFLVLGMVLVLPLCFGKNLFRTLWKMKVMLLTALLIYVFRLLDESGQMGALTDTSRFLSAIAAAALYIETTDLTELSAALGTVLGRIIGKPAWRFASGVMLTIALFPIIFQAATEMLAARESRGGSFFSHPVRNLTDYTVSLMRILFQKILIFQDAMYSRAYSPDTERTAPLYHPQDLVFVLCTLFFLLLTFVL
ncbi:MAG: hypothetical protein KBS81_11715 [Spirochaetales bacterium]|nr:hypothetical protein [Candidatus Physcosoma equi]